MHGDGPPPARTWLEIRCSFCGKSGTEVEKIIAGPTPAVAICSDCVTLCAGIMAEAEEPPGPPDTAA
jgi:hypothetical protein